MVLGLASRSSHAYMRARRSMPISSEAHRKLPCTVAMMSWFATMMCPACQHCSLGQSHSTYDQQIWSDQPDHIGSAQPVPAVLNMCGIWHDSELVNRDQACVSPSSPQRCHFCGAGNTDSGPACRSKHTWAYMQRHTWAHMLPHYNPYI